MDSFSFNTSHVTLYRHSGMSWGLMKSSFNTSHVTLYQGYFKYLWFEELEFQYISCYSLS